MPFAAPWYTFCVRSRTLSAGDATYQDMLVAQMLHDVEHGSVTAAETRRQRESEGHVPTALYIHSMSLSATITATFL